MIQTNLGPVLIVEDDLAIRETLGELMRLEGFIPELAANGQDAIRLLENGIRPCLILLDLMMPVMDGFAFRAKQMKDVRWAEIPVVIMSADGNLQAKMEKLGGNLPSLRKPPDIDAVIDAVRRHCRAPAS